MERAQERHTWRSLVLARAVYSRSAAQWAGHGWGIGAVKKAWATSTAWLPMSKSHSPSQPQLITTLTSEGTKAWTYICFRHDLQILSTVTGKTVTETGVVGQGQNNQLHPDFLVPLSRISKEEQVYVHWLPWFKTEPLLPFPLKTHDINLTLGLCGPF